MAYADGCVVPVPMVQLDAYRRLVRMGGKIWIEHGALEFHESAADDVQPGKLTSFPQAVKLKPGETVVFSWVVFRLRKDRDRVNAEVMVAPRMASMVNANPKDWPFDCKRMFWGGFKSLVCLVR